MRHVRPSLDEVISSFGFVEISWVEAMLLSKELDDFNGLSHFITIVKFKAWELLAWHGGLEL